MRTVPLNRTDSPFRSCRGRARMELAAGTRSSKSAVAERMRREPGVAEAKDPIAGGARHVREPALSVGARDARQARAHRIARGVRRDLDRGPVQRLSVGVGQPAAQPQRESCRAVALRSSRTMRRFFTARDATVSDGEPGREPAGRSMVARAPLVLRSVDASLPARSRTRARNSYAPDRKRSSSTYATSAWPSRAAASECQTLPPRCRISISPVSTPEWRSGTADGDAKRVGLALRLECKRGSFLVEPQKHGVGRAERVGLVAGRVLEPDLERVLAGPADGEIGKRLRASPIGRR